MSSTTTHLIHLILRSIVYGDNALRRCEQCSFIKIILFKVVCYTGLQRFWLFHLRQTIKTFSRHGVIIIIIIIHIYFLFHRIIISYLFYSVVLVSIIITTIIVYSCLLIVLRLFVLIQGLFMYTVCVCRLDVIIKLFIIFIKIINIIIIKVIKHVMLVVNTTIILHTVLRSTIRRDIRGEDGLSINKSV